ncbi:MAG: c-type cytochrome [Gammaproteobacteria bacterium]|nr:MAG: c-type cytochrome [Gammaproteobacteria bacterium]
MHNPFRSPCLARQIVVLLCLASAGVLHAAPADPELIRLGAKIFRDTSLSASGKQACASCHDPAHAHAQANDAAVQSGGAALAVSGFRATPSLRYLNTALPFFFAKDGTPTGGLNRDGRAADLVAQAQRPFFAAHEMANADAAAVVDKLARADYTEQFRAIFGADIFADAELAFFAARYALAAYQGSAPEFRPFSSKFDLFLARKTALSAPELRGFALFNRADKGNCAACHPSTPRDGAPPLFTDYSYDNLGVPRNYAIPATAETSYFDLGLCGPDRTDLAARTDLCGAFKVPTLRNVASRRVFFHNGRFDSLSETIEFYVQRDTNPARWYPASTDGSVRKFDDLPPAYARNVNTSEAPYNRQQGGSPALSAAEIDDVIAFLSTLTDGYDPATGTADPARDVAPIAD